MPPGLKSLGKSGSRRLVVFSLPGVGRTPLQPLVELSWVSTGPVVAYAAAARNGTESSAVHNAVATANEWWSFDIGAPFDDGPRSVSPFAPRGLAGDRVMTAADRCFPGAHGRVAAWVWS